MPFVIGCSCLSTRKSQSAGAMTPAAAPHATADTGRTHNRLGACVNLVAVPDWLPA